MVVTASAKRGGRHSSTSNSTSTANSSNKEKNQSAVTHCGDCKEVIVETPTSYTGQSIECECCLKWLHLTCANLEEDGYKAIMKYKLHWYCSKCDGAASKLYQHVINLQSDTNQIKTDLQDLKNQVEQSEGKIMHKVNSKIDTKVESAKAEILAEVDAKIAAMKDEYPVLPQPAAPEHLHLQNFSPTSSRTRITTAVNEAITEREDQQARKLNLMISNLSEAASSTEETAQVKEMFDTKLNIEENLIITHVTRLGNRHDDGSPRLLKIELQTLAMKRKVLSCATKLRLITDEHDKFYKVYVKPDLTKKQMQESKNLYEQLKKKRTEDADHRYIIAKGKIILVPN